MEWEEVQVFGVSIRVIPTKFKIPKRYRRQFVFIEYQAGFRMDLWFGQGRLVMQQQGELTMHQKRNQSWCLDWMKESIEAVMEELES
jgi:hypothetical protein